MQGSAHPAKLRFGSCVLDDGRGVLTAPGGAETALRPKTHELLRLLLQNAGRVVTRAEILDAVWPDIHVTDDSITQCVTEIRRALGEQGQGLLRTMPRRGYLLEAEVAPEAARPIAAPPRTDDRPSIAVLPFRRDGGDAQDAYFADGIIEGIIHGLAGVGGLLVISLGTSLAFAGTTLDPRAVGQELGVRYALFGGVRRAGDRLRIITELSDTETGAIIRSDRHEGQGSDLFELQDRIAAQVATTLAPQLHAQELARALRKPPESWNAFELVLQAVDRLHRLDRASFDTAEALLQRAKAADPGYAPAHSWSALLHMVRVAQGYTGDVAASFAAAVCDAEAALAGDRNDAVALSIQGHARAFVQRDYAAAMGLFDRALAASPNCAAAWAYSSVTLGYLGEAAEAVRRAEHALRLSPRDPLLFMWQHFLSQACYLADDHAAAITWARQAERGNPLLTANLRVLIASLVASGAMEEAAAAGQRLARVQAGFNLTTFAAHTPLPGAVRDSFVARLRAAGLPD